MAQKAAWLKGAERVIGIDILDYRLDIARRTAQSEIINANDVNAIEVIRDMTEGRGADVCVDAVGLEAQRDFADKLYNFLHLQVGSIEVLKNCMSAVRRGGVVSIIGVYGMSYNNFPIGQIFDKGLTLNSGPVLAHKYLDELLKLVEDKKVVLDDIITHVLPLDQAPYAYEIFRDKKDLCLKVVLKP